jgi:Glycosyltransferase sugar-binding region containing DXD motif
MVSAGEGDEAPIIQYWHSGQPPPEVEETVATFQERNPSLRHMLFDEREAEELIAGHYTSRELGAFRACAVPAMQADYFRYCAVLALGGVYVDVDYRCTAPLQPLLQDRQGGVMFCMDPPGHLLNDFFAFGGPGHPLLGLTLELATANIEARSSELVQIVTGPWIFAAIRVLGRLLREESVQGDLAGEELERLAELFRRQLADMALTAVGRRGIEPMARPILETLLDRPQAEVVHAFDRVRVESMSAMAEHVAAVSEPLPHQQGDTHWVNWQKTGVSVFRG